MKIKVAFIINSAILIFGAFVFLIFVLVGSHGKILIHNHEAMFFLSLSVILVLNALIFAVLINRWNGRELLFCVVTLLNLCLLVFELLYIKPETYTPLSLIVTVIFSIGIIVNTYILFKLIEKRLQ